jgi:aspartyl-tRNA(Asn)/glutamyl-tRNA(Gln) amidotransferase subunit B
MRRPGDPLGTRAEIKNLNSFRFMEQAIEYEAKRQIGILEDGGKVVQETRLYDPDKGETRSMRSKEDAHDYRYFPDPDLLPLVIAESEIERIGSEMPEPLEAVRQSYARQYPLSPHQVALLTSSREMANVSSAALVSAKAEAVPVIANLILGPLAARLNEENLDISQSKISADQIRALAERVADGTISSSAATQVIFPILWAGDGLDYSTQEGLVDEIIEKRGLKQISDPGAIEKVVDEVLAANAKQADDYRAGKDKAFNSLVGQVMKATKGKANPQQVNEILRRKLAG